MEHLQFNEEGLFNNKTKEAMEALWRKRFIDERVGFDSQEIPTQLKAMKTS